eukprot:1312427-Pyramimonas_sp.AAC.1
MLIESCLSNFYDVVHASTLRNVGVVRALPDTAPKAFWGRATSRTCGIRILHNATLCTALPGPHARSCGVFDGRPTFRPLGFVERG